MAVVDGLEGIPEAITGAFPDCILQNCIAHLVRNSMQFASWKEHKALAKVLWPINTAISAEAAADGSDEFQRGSWGEKYPAITASWRLRWSEIVPFFAFSAEVRKIIYTTNAIESLNSQVRRAVRNKGHFPSDQAATKLIYLALRQIVAK